MKLSSNSIFKLSWKLLDKI